MSPEMGILGMPMLPDWFLIFQTKETPTMLYGEAKMSNVNLMDSSSNWIQFILYGQENHMASSDTVLTTDMQIPNMILMI